MPRRHAPNYFLCQRLTHNASKHCVTIEHTLEDITRKEDLPLTVAMSAGRFAAMRMFQLQGRAETLAFIDQCITTAELCEDIVRHLDEDA